MDESEADPRIGLILQDRYRVQERIAAGGMGVVYRGERLQLGRAVAIKFLHPWVAEQPSVRARFSIEARAMSRLQHPACVSVIDFGVEDGAPYLVMDHVVGKTLKTLLAETGRLPAAHALEIGRQLLAGLAHAHACDIVHRDIKPDNVVISDIGGPVGHVRILDFGLAKLRDSNTNLTTGMAVGTPSYMAPEQTCGRPVDARSDVYSTGVLLFELLTGRRPFESDRVADIMAMHRQMPPPSLRSIVPELSPELDATVRRALSKQPEDRHATAAEFATALDATPEGRRDGAAASRESPAEAPRAQPSSGASMDAASADTIDAAHAATVAVARRAAADVAVQRRRRPTLLAALTGRRWKAMVGMAGAAALVVALGTRSCRTRNNERAIAAAPLPAPEPAAKDTHTVGLTDEDLPGIDEVRALVRARRIEAAIKQLHVLGRRYPESAYVPYLEGTLCMTQLWWSEGLDAYARATSMHAPYARNPELIRNLVHALISDRHYQRAAEMLQRQVGEPAIAFLREAKEHDDSQRLRQRAAQVLDRIEQGQ